MKSLKTISILFLSALMLTLSAVACSKDKDDSSSSSSQTAVSTYVADREESKEAEQSKETKESETEKPSEANELLGKWKMVFDEAKFDDVFSSYTEEERTQSKALISMIEMTYDFKADGKVVCGMTSILGGDDNTIESTWTREGDTITVAAAKKETSNGGSFGIQESLLKFEDNKLTPISDNLSLKVIHFEKA